MAPADGRSLLRLIACGSVDDGKSTLLGRLLHDAGGLADDQLAALQRDSLRHGTTGDEVDYALLLDGLEAERQQGITIDVAYRFFSTPQRAFIVADAPGHEDYTRNMATGASVSDLAVLLVDARRGLLPQTRRHSLILSLLGVRKLVLAVNKMDLAGWGEAVFREVEAAFGAFAADLRFDEIVAIPVSARRGDNVAVRSGAAPWWTGPSLLEHLETVDVDGVRPDAPFRLPVQGVHRPNADFRGYFGTVAGGDLRPGDPVVVAGSGRETRVARIVAPDRDLEHAAAGDAVTLTLQDELDIARGDMLCAPRDRPEVSDQFAAHLLWFGSEPLLPSRSYLLKIGHRHVAAQVTSIKHKLDVDTAQHLAAAKLELNEIGLCNLSTAEAIAFDPYAANRTTGGFILIDRITNATVGAGMIEFSLNRASNIHWQDLLVSRADRERLNGHRAMCVWLTGLSGSGKSTIANLVERQLHEAGVRTFLLDGDNLRHGLCRDLGFTDADRVENLRRAGEVAKLMTASGTVVICAFISPFEGERRGVRELFAPGEFLEVFVDAPLEVCAGRDPKGLYAKARSGLIKNFTGIDSPYEPPEAPDLRVDAERLTPAEGARAVLALLDAAGLNARS